MRPSVPLGYYDPSAMDGIEIRVAQPEDFDDIVEVCSASLGWKDPDFDRALFRWKHAANPFGRSLIMVAELDGRLVAVRPFMRWRFRRGDDILIAARAVDTATHPDARGKGLFRTLTEAGIELLREEGVDFIFNTPNDQSRPGYLKMGWLEAGQIPVGFRPRSLFTLANLRGARVPATRPLSRWTSGLASRRVWRPQRRPITARSTAGSPTTTSPPCAGVSAKDRSPTVGCPAPPGAA